MDTEILSSEPAVRVRNPAPKWLDERISLTGNLIHTLVSPNEEEFGSFGSSLSGIGDANGDGRSDVIVGAPYEEPRTSPNIFDGATGELLHTLVSPNEQEDGKFGCCVSGIGDVNGDGRGDVIVGADTEYPGSSPQYSGQAYVFDGASGKLLHVLASPNEGGGQFGRSVSGVEDANGDGWPDVIVGSPCESPGTSPKGAGRAYIFYLGPETISTMIESFYHLVLGREPEEGAVEAWEQGYFNYAVDFDIDVRFVPREMGRLFFLSDEYAARERTDARFITDCYWTFLSRYPQTQELDNWTSGEWNRAEAMTIFAESEEFAARVTKMYPDMAGNPTRNFVTTMYIGLLDRLVDQSGLEYASSVFDAAFAQGGLEGCRAQAKQMARDILVSEEFLSKNPTTEDYVIRFYRAFLGRFPSASEIIYWSAELDSGRRTTNDLIEIFADSPEFTGRLQEYFGNP